MSAQKVSKATASIPKGSHCTGIWFDKELHRKIKRKAKSQGLSVSSYLRQLAHRDINFQA